MMSFPARFQKQSIPLLFLLILFVFSCEYELPEKFTEVPMEYNPPELSFLSVDMNADTLYICGATRFSFSLISSAQGIEGGSVTCLSKTFDFKGPNGFFDVNPDGFADGQYLVEMKVYTRSGTGSLADALGTEGYLFSKEWVLKIERPSTIKIKFLEPEIVDGFLKVRWEKFGRPYFDSYQIQINDSSLHHSYSQTILNSSTNYLIDSSFVGGSVTFSISVTIRDCGGNPVKYFSDMMVYRFPVKMKFEESMDTLYISWTKNPFKHIVYMDTGSQPVTIGTADSYKILAPGIGLIKRYNLSFKPTIKLTWDHQRYNVYENYTIGYKSAMEFNRMAYLPEKNIFLVKHAMYFRMYNGTSLSRLGTFDYSWDYTDGETIAASPGITRLFTTSQQDITQFSSDAFRLTDRKKFSPGETGSKTFKIMHILNDSLMYIGYNSTLSIYNYQTGKEKSKISMWNSNGYPYNTSISKDGKYIANCSNTLLSIFRNDNDTLVKVYSQSGDFYQCIFDPANAGNLLIITPSTDYVVHCPDMTLVCNFPAEIRGLAVNFDPITNDLLMVSTVTKKITVYDYVNNIIKFQCMHHSNYKELYLANGTVYHKSGYYINKDYDFYEK